MSRARKYLGFEPNTDLSDGLWLQFQWGVGSR
jgi:hypothetical protein